MKSSPAISWTWMRPEAPGRFRPRFPIKPRFFRDAIALIIRYYVKYKYLKNNKTIFIPWGMGWKFPENLLRWCSLTIHPSLRSQSIKIYLDIFMIWINIRVKIPRKNARLSLNLTRSRLRTHAIPPLGMQLGRLVRLVTQQSVVGMPKLTVVVDRRQKWPSVTTGSEQSTLYKLVDYLHYSSAVIFDLRHDKIFDISQIVETQQEIKKKYNAPNAKYIIGHSAE